MEETQSCELLDFGCHIGNIGVFIADAFLWIWEQILAGIIFVLNGIPVPDWMASASSFVLPDGVMWFASVLELPYGISVMTGAWVLRFVIRRIPVIG